MNSMKLLDAKSFLSQQIGDSQFEDWGSIQLGNNALPDTRRWLATDGTGSYIADALTGARLSRYDGLVIALSPPVDRVSLLAGTDEILMVPNDASVPPTTYELATNYWRSGNISPQGWRFLKSFSYTICPTWVFELKEGWLVKQALMLSDERRLVLGYTWVARAACAPVQLRLELVANCRGFHQETRGSESWQFQQFVTDGSVEIKAYDTAPSLTVTFDRGHYQEQPAWWWGYFWPEERARGLTDSEDCFHAGSLTAQLEDGHSLTVCAGLAHDQHMSIDEAVKRLWNRRRQLLERSGDSQSTFVHSLVLAADQFLVQRLSSNSKSVIAGYPWFNDWGRDTMISLPGLCLATGRYEEACSILETFARYLSEGMIPNNFPDADEQPHYNTADATLWWAWTLKEYLQQTDDLNFIEAQLPLLRSVVEWHVKGTRFGIKVDPEDGLLAVGEPGVQLTWMDAKVGDYVVTPREGKPVEINALWYNFLREVEYFHQTSSDYLSGSEKKQHVDFAVHCSELAEQAKAGFEKFWIEESGYLADVIRRDGSRDLALRPNMMIALSLPYPILDLERGKSVLSEAEKYLLTPYGFRTLSPNDPAYCGQYGGGKEEANQFDRDVTYHQGTVWPWLLGPWVDARLRVYGPTAENLDFLDQHFSDLERHTLHEACVGSVSEIFDGDPPHTPRGCYAQAWSVAEILRALKKIKILKQRLDS
jgi:predicted glycogen debranching enzyme